VAFFCLRAASSGWVFLQISYPKSKLTVTAIPQQRSPATEHILPGIDPAAPRSATLPAPPAW